MTLKESIEKYESEIIKEEVPIEYRVTEEAKKHPKTPIYFPKFPNGPLLINLWASRSRLADYFDIEKGQIIEKLADAVDEPTQTKRVNRAEFEDNVEKNVDLTKLPIPKYYPKDGGRYITSGIVIAEHKGVRNLSYHRLMLRDDKTFTIRMCPRHLKKMYDQALEEKDHLDIAIVIGVNPAVLLAASTSIDYEIDESEIANSLLDSTLGKKVKMTELENGISVPADGEYILQGRITAEKDDEGPFVDITGTYDKVRQQLVVEIDRIYKKEDAIFHGLLPGGNEHFLLMGLPRESVLKRELNKITDIEDVRLTEGGCSWLHGVISVKHEGADVEKIIEKAFEAHSSMKKITVVNNDIDIFEDHEVEWAVATRFQPDKDIYVHENKKGSSLDPSAPDLTAKWGLDATRPWEGEEFERAKAE
ncbi:MAG: UbiD family decarboxylase [Candidatus Thermoplasmatota archaeon]